MKVGDSHEKLDEDKHFCLDVLRLAKDIAGANGSVWADIQFEWGPSEFYPRPKIRLSIKCQGEDDKQPRCEGGEHER